MPLFAFIPIVLRLPKSAYGLGLCDPILTASHGGQLANRGQTPEDQPIQGHGQRGGRHQGSETFDPRDDRSGDGFPLDRPIGRSDGERDLGTKLFDGQLETRGEPILVETIVGPSARKRDSTSVLYLGQSRLRSYALSSRP